MDAIVCQAAEIVAAGAQDEEQVDENFIEGKPADRKEMPKQPKKPKKPD